MKREICIVSSLEKLIAHIYQTTSHLFDKFQIHQNRYKFICSECVVKFDRRSAAVNIVMWTSQVKRMNLQLTSHE